MRPVPLAIAVAAALGSTSVLAAPPTAPTDLRVDVYSGTAAELFWAHSTDPDGAVRGYEIRRDGQLVDTRDGLSYFTDSLTDGRAFAFTVTAVDFDGERSAPASVSVVGGDRDGSVGAGGGRPPPPANLSSSVYSSSAAEVFWDRSDQPGLTYEVSVDGGPVTRTDGTSAFLSGLDGARGRGVDVVAIDANGQRSGAANVTLGGGEPNPPSGGGGGGSDVPAPSSLRAELYSGSAGEVFWDRVAGANLSYEVRLDGETVATTNGTSYFVGNRPGLDGTSVEVVAIGPGGSRSDASSTTLGGGGGSSNPDPDPDPGTDAPPAPANARIEVYSGTAAELFFDRAPASANVVETEIVRNGETLGTTNGTSFFDPNRTPGRSYVYELIAIDATGARSAPSTIGSEPSDPATTPGTSPVRERFYRDVLDEADRIVSGAWAGKVLEFSSSGALQFLNDEREATDVGGRDVFDCPSGGTATRQELPSGGQSESAYLFFDRCRSDGFLLRGGLTRTNSGTGGRFSTTITITLGFDGFSVEGGPPDDLGLTSVRIADGELSRSTTTRSNTTCPSTDLSSEFEIDVTDASASTPFDEVYTVDSVRYARSTERGRLNDGDASDTSGCYDTLDITETGEAVGISDSLPRAPSGELPRATIETDIELDSRDEVRPESTGTLSLTYSPSESITATLESVEDGTARVDIDGGGSSTSEVLPYRFVIPF